MNTQPRNLFLHLEQNFVKSQRTQRNISLRMISRTCELYRSGDSGW